MLRVCRALLGHPDADDAWWETFVAAMRAYPDLPGDANVEAWLVTIAHRKAIDVHRAASRRAIPVDAVPQQPAVPAPDPADPADHDDLYAALRRLPAKQRQAVAYHHLAGLPHREAAARLASADGMQALRSTYQQNRASR